MPTNEPSTWYPGIGSEEATERLHRLVGKITAHWALVEDSLFELFIVALTGKTWVDNFAPYRSVFFSFSSYEGKMKMIDAAMRSRYANDDAKLQKWIIIRKDCNSYSQIRNTVAHPIPTCKSSQDPNAHANVRLIPARWKSDLSISRSNDFDKLGYSESELWDAIANFFGVNEMKPLEPIHNYQLPYRIHEFCALISTQPQIQSEN